MLCNYNNKNQINNDDIYIVPLSRNSYQLKAIYAD